MSSTDKPERRNASVKETGEELPQDQWSGSRRPSRLRKASPSRASALQPGRAATPTSLGNEIPKADSRGWRQICRSTIICLIWLIALAGFSPFGQAFAQFMIVWQR